MSLNADALLDRLTHVAQRAELGLALSVYAGATLGALLEPLARYLAEVRPEPPRRRWFWQRPEPNGRRVAPLLLAGPVGTGKTTLMMLLDRALPDASCAGLFQQEIPAHPSTAQGRSGPECIEVRPLALMGQSQTLPTGVVRLRHLQRFHRLYTYDRATARRDAEADARFVRLFAGRILFVDEFVPDTVSSFGMQVINRLADGGVQVVLSSNRRETPFVAGVEVIPVLGEDMRGGDLARVLLSAGPDGRFDALAQESPVPFDHVARGLKARLLDVAGQRRMALRFDELARTAAEWLAFQQLVQQADAVLIDGVPLFDPAQEVGPDAARRFVLLVDALYDERRPTLVRLTNAVPLPATFEIEQLAAHYLPEVLVDLERALSRLRQLSALVGALP